jgi:hypothetical protein
VPDWRDRSLPDLLAEHGLEAAVERDFPTDGWSGATFSTLEDHSGRRFVLKRTSLERDWIARATQDDRLREAWLAGADPTGFDSGSVGPGASAESGARVGTAYFGAAADGDGVAAILMPDLSDSLIAWERAGVDPVIDPATLQRVLGALATLHRRPWADALEDVAAVAGEPPLPWCPLPERLLLLSRPSAEGYARDANPVGPRFLAGWDAFEQYAPPGAVGLIRDLSADVQPLVAALGQLPIAGLHGDLKLANVALLPEGEVALIDWQMSLRAPVAVELGWFLVSNSASLPDTPEALLDDYREASLALARGGNGGQELLHEWDTQLDLALLVGLLLRGWRKGLDTAAGATLASGVSAADDLAWWSEHAIAAAARRL